ncbi:MAG TPA: hypothetical protein VGG19_01450 [Tepidisphaeraceae bacterium]|jgi:hypothetical protein
MKWKFNLPSVLLFAAAARVSAGTVGFISFDESITLGTDVFETPGGPVTTTAVGITTWLSPTAAADLAADPTVPAQLQGALSAFPQVSDYEFLTEQGPNYIVLNDIGPAINDGSGDLTIDVPAALATAGGSDYAVTNVVTSFIGVFSYTFYAFDQNGDEEVGTVNFNVGNVSETEQQIVPEPSTLSVCAFIGLSCWTRINGRKV